MPQTIVAATGATQEQWARMLGAPPLPGTKDDRPPPPRSLGLNKLVKAHLRLQRGTPRTHGFHPSELPYLCPVLFREVELARENVCSEDPQVVKRAWDFLRAVCDAKEQSFSPEVRMEFKVGSAIHSEVQYRLGLTGRLWGRWQCAKCDARTTEGWMPRVLIEDINGQPIYAPAPCVGCNGANRRNNIPWVYLEPRVESVEWGVVGRADGDLRVKHGDHWYRFILEVKSRNRAGFEGKRGPLPAPEHIQQASIYAWLMGVEWICLVYVCKDQVSRWKEYIVPVDPVAVADAQNKIRAVLWGRENNQLPVYARVCASVQDVRAKACPAVERCFGRRPAPNFWDE